ncbi:hypothetical protein A3D42_00545 [Candidatus Nomurabacteria bacterium RIFCSPHIGHO2_02_FULL_41_18]|uniref:Band 7 domain-containing protein n=1 Tax=Candidatus Nomurabacteria bacterium RIFCSPHIGHO2_02_FULL_41_18 TaxID=1801754 RepID=A0A1F6W7N9_9BACT|nr:MAG: hypothetical protein A2737_02550 [Candidatus Nomurabacteria bacterium RIFCSPHIGHO2_01_FULL_41_71]OGI77909.1 MAG: hypothetical protein A3D42_00545 [Candidatus Nomurabacteria bacterium RIFCSPHIGHO2_02_FULL_41_18]
MTVFFGVLGAVLLQGLRRIPASPPHKGQVTFLGKRVPGKFYDEGWGFFLFYPYLFGFVLVRVERITFQLVSEKTRTPDRAESRVPVFVTVRPESTLLTEYVDSGQEAGVRGQLEGKIFERIREWAMGPEEGPANWVELNQAHLEAVSVLVKKIAGNSLTAIPPYAQPVPTWIWLRYFALPRPTVFLKNEKPWAANGWRRVRDVLAEIERVHGLGAVRTLEIAVEARRAEIDALRTGAGKVILRDLGVRLERLNIGDIDALGEVGRQAEQEAKEVQERQAEILELQHFSERVQALMAAPPAGPGLTREQAIEQVQLALGQLKKEARTQGFALDPATAELVARILAGFGRRP